MLRALVGIEALLVAAYLLSRDPDIPWAFRTLVNLDGERSIGMWFSVVQHAAVGGVAVWIASELRTDQPDLAIFHGCAGALFFVLSLDECVGLHETIGGIIRRHVLQDAGTPRLGLWMPFYVAALAILLAAGYFWLQRVGPALRRSLLPATGGLLMFAFGALGPELIANLYLRDPSSALHAFYALEVAIEEFLEMLGVTIVLCSLLATRHARTCGADRERSQEFRPPQGDETCPADT